MTQIEHAVIMDYIPQEWVSDSKLIQSHSPIGPRSSPVYSMAVGHQDIALIQRYNCQRVVPSHAINFSSNIWALYQLGVKYIVSLSVIGSLDLKYELGSVLIPSDFLDFTKFRKDSFYSQPLEEGVAFGSPYSEHMRRVAYDVLDRSSINSVFDTCCVTVEGPRLPSPSESHYYVKHNGDGVSYVDYPENVLSQELAMQYLFLGLVGWLSPGIGRLNCQAYQKNDIYEASVSQLGELIKEILSKLTKES